MQGNSYVIYTFRLLIAMAVFIIQSCDMLPVKRNSSREEAQLAAEHLQTVYKTLLLVNRTQQGAICIVNFEFTEREIKNGDIEILDYNDKIDTVYLTPGESTTIVSPIPVQSAITFPKNFYLSVCDSSFKQRYRFNAAQFLEEVEIAKTGKWKFSIE